MSYLNWKVGDKIVCVEAGSITGGFGGVDPVGLVVGRIYTIRWIGLHDFRLDSNVVSVRLCEWVRDNWDDPVGASRFRPVQTRKTSIEIFTRMLTPKRRVKA